MKFAGLACSFLLFFLSCSLASEQQDDVNENLWNKNIDVADKTITSCSLASNQQNDVYENLWNKNKDLAKSTLNTDFLQQMQSGSLQAERFVKFTLQDINYLLKVTEMLSEMSQKVKKPEDISDFMKGRYQSYKRFADSVLNQYFLKDALPIKPTPAMQTYLSDYRAVMSENNPIYFAVALLPCNRLWPWLANNTNIPKTSAYYTWKTSNSEDHSEKHFKAIINKYINTTEEEMKANAIFLMQMQNELNFFATS